MKHMHLNKQNVETENIKIGSMRTIYKERNKEKCDLMIVSNVPTSFETEQLYEKGKDSSFIFL
jgi:hypothetical protein